MKVLPVYAHPTPNSFCLAQQEKVAQAEALAFIVPVFWPGFPAILKGWIERVFAYYLTPEGRVPLLHYEKALVISTTFFKQDDYEGAGLRQAMTTKTDDFGLRHPRGQRGGTRLFPCCARSGRHRTEIPAARLSPGQGVCRIRRALTASWMEPVPWSC